MICPCAEINNAVVLLGIFLLNFEARVVQNFLLPVIITIDPEVPIFDCNQATIFCGRQDKDILTVFLQFGFDNFRASSWILMVLGAFNVSGVIFKPMGSSLDNIFLATWAKLISEWSRGWSVDGNFRHVTLKVLESVTTPFFI